ncbi:hypothetical protein EJ04DRAFT_529625, partial [Polyplosphaeria fusca]
RNSCSDGARQAGGEATVIDTAAAIGGDEQGDVRAGIGEGAGIDRDGVGIDRDGVGIDRDGVGIDRDGVGIDRDGAGIDRDGIGIARDGAGIDRDGAELRRVSDPEDYAEVEIEIKKAAHVVQKLMDLGELMPRSSLGHLAFEQVVALEQNGMALGIAYGGMGDRLSFQRGQNKGDRHVVVSAPAGAIDPVA